MREYQDDVIPKNGRNTIKITVWSDKDIEKKLADDTEFISHKTFKMEIEKIDRHMADKTKAMLKKSEAKYAAYVLKIVRLKKVIESLLEISTESDDDLDSYCPP